MLKAKDAVTVEPSQRDAHDLRPERELEGSRGYLDSHLAKRSAGDRDATVPGSPIDAGARGPFEKAFGHSFATVRIHADGRGTRPGQAAVTTGEHISFAAGRYSPGSVPGRMLLAHELAHVVQQRAIGASPTLEREAEAEADVVATRAFIGQPVAVQAHRSVGPAGASWDPRVWEAKARAAVHEEIQKNIQTIRTKSGEYLGYVEAVAMAGAGAVDTALWVEDKGLQMVDKAVDHAADIAHLSPQARESAHAVANGAVIALVPPAAGAMVTRKIARASGMVDPDTGARRFRV